MAKYRINNNIRKLRFFQNEMTQQQLADKVGVTRQTIIAMEQGKYSPPWSWPFALRSPSVSRWTRSSHTTLKLKPNEELKPERF